MNAALQALLALPRVKRLLFDCWESLSGSERDSLSARALETRKPTFDLHIPGPELEQVLPRTSPVGVEEVSLAATFHSMFVRLLPGERYAHSTEISPWLLLDHYYHGRQEDAVEFFTRCLLDRKVCPRISAVACGTLGATLRCQHCAHAHEKKRLSIPSICLLLPAPMAVLFRTSKLQ